MESPSLIAHRNDITKFFNYEPSPSYGGGAADGGSR
jgi:hypothetical protein